MTGRGGGHHARRRAPALALVPAFLGYLAVSVVLWWHVWSSHPSTVTTCGCGDASLFLWFLEWPAYALAHGHDPFYSTALFHPGGIDLLSNTSVLAVGVVLAPVTWAFGPVATMNVASTLAPALAALAMFWLLRRWVAWAPAAFVGGLLFGFSSFVFVNLAGGHLMSGVLVLLPLMVGALDELLVRQRRRAVPVGVALGLLAVIQFFVSTEMLLIVTMAAVVGVVVLLAYGAVRCRRELHARLPHAARGLAVAVVVAGALLAYPAWFALDGPAHLSGLVWPTLEPGAGGIVLSNLWHLRPMTALRDTMQAIGGYEGPALPPPEYLGLGLLLVLGAGVVVFWRDRRLWFFAVLGLVLVALSLGVETHAWVPWRVLAHVPLIRSIIPDRFVAGVTLCAAVLVAEVVDQCHRSATRVARRIGVLGGVVAGALSVAVAAAAVVPAASALARNVPFTVEPVALPAWFARVAPRLPPGQVVLTIPAPFSLVQSAMAWQAVDGLHFALVGGSGPEGIPARAGPERRGMVVAGDASISFTGPPAPSAAHVGALRRALGQWGVTDVVMVDPALVPRYDRGTSPAAALGLFTLALGRPPGYRDGAWVWAGVRTPSPVRAVAAAAFARCTAGGLVPAAPHGRVPACVMAASHPDR